MFVCRWYLFLLRFLFLLIDIKQCVMCEIFRCSIYKDIQKVNCFSVQAIGLNGDCCEFIKCLDSNGNIVSVDLNYFSQFFIYGIFQFGYFGFRFNYKFFFFGLIGRRFVVGLEFGVVRLECFIDGELVGMIWIYINNVFIVVWIFNGFVVIFI